MKVAAVVPSLNPDKEFVAVIEGLVNAGFKRIYVVNDGSAPAYDSFFDQAAAYPQCIVLRHAQNQGKGRALKTAFARYLADDEGLLGLVTLDGDGQHSTEDVVRVAKALAESPNTLVLGARDFSGTHVPAKSAMGNKMTRAVFKIICGIPITDTQTGLRAVPNSFARVLLDVAGERYEFETNMLLETKRAHVAVKEIPISTIYIDNNSASHFRPLQDGLRIYMLILKFTLSSLASFLVDFSLFALLNWLLAGLPAGQRLLLATVGSRLCSALFNFLMNKNVVFDSTAKTGSALVRYAVLCVCQMLCSYGGVYFFSEILPVPTLLSKILVDGTLFFISFFIQRRWVFKDKA